MRRFSEDPQGGLVEAAISQDGTRIAFARSGAGPPMVLVHGMVADHTYWDAVRPSLAEHFTVLAMDRRGRGASGPQGARYAIEREVEDVIAVVDACGEPVHLVGHSGGARYALHAAQRIPERLRSLVLYEPAPFEQLPPAEILARLEVQGRGGDRSGILQTFLGDYLGYPDDLMRALRASPRWKSYEGAAPPLPGELRSAAGYVFDPAPFASFAVPTLVMSGSESPRLLTEPADEIAAAIPTSRRVVLEGQAHEAPETGPALFVREVLRFLEAMEPSTAALDTPQADLHP